MIREKQVKVMSGYVMVAVLVVTLVLCIWLLIDSASKQQPLWVIAAILLSIINVLCFIGLFLVQPNESKVLQLFGDYVGSVHEPGLKWANPFYGKTAVSKRIRNFESGKLKVNDSQGNPIEIAAVVVWKVYDTAEALFEVDDYEEFVRIQSESALRNLSTTYPYEPNDAEVVALRANPAEIATALKDEIQDRLDQAGVSVIEARISHLAYAPEIANAMLKRQQASAVVAARREIVSGAVGMVEMALEDLSQKNIIKLDEERKAAMVTNLLVVLCGEEQAKPVINTGTLYS